MRLSAKLKHTHGPRTTSREDRRKHPRALAAPTHHDRREDVMGFPVAAGYLTASPAYRRCR